QARRDRAAVVGQRHRECAVQSRGDVVRVSFDLEAVPAGTVRRFELKQRRWTDDRMGRLAGN
ncbi:MAG: hypothetical protein H7Y16_00770, partial [Candidatus Parcubacteria bacterium]|nr:hypothetical protein [Burkholderiales bacterium]